MVTLAGAIVIASSEEMGKNEHCHEGTYETTPVVQTCVPFVTGSYVAAPTTHWNG